MNQSLLIEKHNPRTAPATDLCRVLHLINGEHYSGAERVQDLLAMSLPEFGFQVGFACLKPDRFASQRQSQECELHKVQMKSRWDLRFISALSETVRRGRYELIHAHTPRTLLVGYLVARRCRLPLVYHVHSPVGRDSTRPWQNRINRHVETWLAKRASHLICVSDSLHDYMVELGHRRERMTTVANGVATIRDLPARQPPPGMWTLGTTALFRPRKGIEVLMEALAELNRNRVPVKLVAVGPFESEQYRDSIFSLADKLRIANLIHWTGFVSNVNPYFQKMDAFVLPSLFGEGLPMVILEAMANGTPVVAAGVEGVTQAIRDGRDGLIFNAGDASHLAQKIQELVDDPRQWSAIRESALDRQRRLFSDESMARGVAVVYQRVRSLAK